MIKFPKKIHTYFNTSHYGLIKVKGKVKLTTWHPATLIKLYSAKSVIKSSNKNSEGHIEVIVSRIINGKIASYLLNFTKELSELKSENNYY